MNGSAQDLMTRTATSPWSQQPRTEEVLEKLVLRCFR
jgi:hypothetical protein